ncbi:MAG: carboxypeptidase-like regulatory domain-containing protein [Planctomycetales bacterium]|nr:carboxypeptidase-like regulatory domain-containing protein [Planctomycetales bacterium]
MAGIPGAEVVAWLLLPELKGGSLLYEWHWKTEPLGTPAVNARSNEQGAFALELPERGWWLVRATSPGLRPEFREFDARPGQEQNQELWLDPAAEWDYTVLDEDGVGIRDAEVFLYPRGRVQGRPRAVLLTGEGGRFRADLVETEILVVRAKGFAVGHSWARELWSGSKIVLHPGSRVAGVALDAKGNPIGGARVFLNRYPHNPKGTVIPPEEVSAGPEGRFEFDGIDPGLSGGRVGLGAEAAGFSIGWVHATAGDEHVRLALRTEAEAKAEDEVGSARRAACQSFVRVRVESPLGEPLPGIKVPCSLPTEPPPAEPTDEEGRTLLKVGVPPGWSDALCDRYVPVRHGYRWYLWPAASEVQTGGADTPEATVRLLDAVAVTFVVRGPGGGDYAGEHAASVHCSGESCASREWGSWDRYTFLVRPGHHYRVQAWACGFGPGRLDDWTATPGESEAEIRLSAPARISGRLLDTEGAPVGDAALKVVYPQPPLSNAVCARSWHFLGTAQDGRFVIQDLPGGPVWIVACRRDGRLEAWRQVEVEPGAAVEVGDITLSTRPVTGVVVDTSERPVAAATVRAVLPGLDCVDFLVTTTRPDGSFSVRVPVGAPIHLLVSRPGFGTVPVPVPAAGAGTSLRVGLPPEGFLRYRIEGFAFRLGRIELSTPGRGVAWSPTEADWPERRIKGLAPGRVIVRAAVAEPVTGGGKAAREECEKEVEIVAGQTTEVVLEPRAGR